MELMVQLDHREKRVMKELVEPREFLESKEMPDLMVFLEHLESRE